MPFHRRMGGLRPINTTKHIIDVSGILASGTNTVLASVITGTDNPVLSNADDVQAGSKITSAFFELFFIAEGGELANEVPLVDWYVIKVPGNTWTTFGGVALPTPGGTGTHVNKRHILHEEKGLTGGGDVSLAGIPMVFKGVIRIPRGRQRWGQLDSLKIIARANFATKFCIKVIYKEIK